jgi:hypothetical protein
MAQRGGILSAMTRRVVVVAGLLVVVAALLGFVIGRSTAPDADPSTDNCVYAFRVAERATAEALTNTAIHGDSSTEAQGAVDRMVVARDDAAGVCGLGEYGPPPIDPPGS